MFIYLQMIETEEERSKFEKVYMEYRGLMYSAANRILKNEQDAEDAVHQAFVSIAENIKKVDEPICPRTKGYVVTIAENKAIDIYRKRKRERELDFIEGNVGLRVEYAGSFALAQCVATLNPRYRLILTLKHGHGFNNKEIAKIMNITEANAIKLEQRAKAKLLQLCEEDDFL